MLRLHELEVGSFLGSANNGIVCQIAKTSADHSGGASVEIIDRDGRNKTAGSSVIDGLTTAPLTIGNRIEHAFGTEGGLILKMWDSPLEVIRASAAATGGQAIAIAFDELPASAQQLVITGIFSE